MLLVTLLFYVPSLILPVSSPPPPQLYDTDEDVAMEALDVLDEACEEEVSSSYVSAHSPLFSTQCIQQYF